MPGHMLAALASYPHLGCRGQGYEVWTHWGISPDVICLGRESSYEFLMDVIDEVLALFPSDMIHIGGDEAPTVRWEECPDCRRFMEEHGTMMMLSFSAAAAKSAALPFGAFTSM